MKVFQVDEENWYAGETAQEAIEAYIKDAGEEVRKYVQKFGDPVEITDEQLDKLTITDVDEPGQPKYTFRRALETRKGPGFIASTRY